MRRLRMFPIIYEYKMWVKYPLLYVGFVIMVGLVVKLYITLLETFFFIDRLD